MKKPNQSGSFPLFYKMRADSAHNFFFQTPPTLVKKSFKKKLLKLQTNNIFIPKSSFAKKGQYGLGIIHALLASIGSILLLQVLWKKLPFWLNMHEDVEVYYYKWYCNVSFLLFFEC